MRINQYTQSQVYVNVVSVKEEFCLSYVGFDSRVSTAYLFFTEKEQWARYELLELEPHCLNFVA